MLIPQARNNPMEVINSMVTSWGTDKVEEARLSRIHKAWLAFNGDLPDSFKRRAGAPDDNIKVNYAKVIVTVGVAKLFGSDVQFSFDPKGAPDVDPLSGKAEPEAQNSLERQYVNYLDSVWDYNQKLTLLQKMATNAAVCGDGFLKIYNSARHPVPKLINLDPANVCLYTEDHDNTEVYKYVIRWTGIDRTNPAAPRDAYFRQVIEIDKETYARWSIVEQVVHKIHLKNAFPIESDWQTIATDVWAYSFSPIVHFPNLPQANDIYGMSDLEADVIRLNAQINYALTNINRILRLHAHPKTWTKGLTPEQIQQIQMSADGMVHLPGDFAELHNLEMTSDLDSSIRYFLELRQALHEIAQVPEVATGKVENLGSLSGSALQILYEPLTERSKTKRGPMGYGLRETNRRLLALKGFGDNLLCSLNWPDIIPGNPFEEAQTAVNDMQIGASRDSLLERRGYNPQVERMRRQLDAEEDQEKVANQMLAMARGQGGVDPRGLTTDTPTDEE